VEARKDGVPRRTQQDTLYCTRLWDEWCKHRDTVTGVKIAPLVELSESELNHQLTSFIIEVRKKDGSLYTPNSLHHLVAGLVRDLRQNGRNIDIFKDPGYSTFRASLDAEMIRISREGIGSKKKQAEIITEEEEELLWVQGLLGDETPQRLLDTVVFYNGLYFALRSGLEHRQLRRRPCQIEVVERPNERPYLLDISKNRPGGLKGCNTKPKVVKHHANLEAPHRRFVCLFKMYQSLCPPDAPEGGGGYSTCNQLANLHQPAGFQGNPLVTTNWRKLFQECAVLPELRDTKQTTHFVQRLQAVFTIQGLTSNWWWNALGTEVLMVFVATNEHQKAREKPFQTYWTGKNHG
jgi:hypothetical protein